MLSVALTVNLYVPTGGTTLSLVVIVVPLIVKYPFAFPSVISYL